MSSAFPQTSIRIWTAENGIFSEQKYTNPFTFDVNKSYAVLSETVDSLDNVTEYHAHAVSPASDSREQRDQLASLLLQADFMDTARKNGFVLVRNVFGFESPDFVSLFPSGLHLSNDGCMTQFSNADGLWTIEPHAIAPEVAPVVMGGAVSASRLSNGTCGLLVKDGSPYLFIGGDSPDLLVPQAYRVVSHLLPDAYTQVVDAASMAELCGGSTDQFISTGEQKPVSTFDTFKEVYLYYVSLGDDQNVDLSDRGLVEIPDCERRPRPEEGLSRSLVNPNGFSLLDRSDMLVVFIGKAVEDALPSSIDFTGQFIEQQIEPQGRDPRIAIAYVIAGNEPVWITSYFTDYALQYVADWLQPVHIRFGRKALPQLIEGDKGVEALSQLSDQSTENSVGALIRAKTGEDGVTLTADVADLYHGHSIERFSAQMPSVWAIIDQTLYPMSGASLGVFYEETQYAILDEPTHFGEPRLLVWSGSKCQLDQRGSMIFSLGQNDARFGSAMVQTRILEGSEPGYFTRMFDGIVIRKGKAAVSTSFDSLCYYGSTGVGSGAFVFRETPQEEVVFRSDTVWLVCKGLKAFIWVGSDASGRQIAAAKSVSQRVVGVNGKPGSVDGAIVVRQGSETPEFRALAGDIPVQERKPVPIDYADRMVLYERQPRLFSVGDDAEGFILVRQVPLSQDQLLVGKQPFALDLYDSVYIWLPPALSTPEHMTMAHDIARRYCILAGQRDRCPVPVIVNVVCAGQEPEEFAARFPEWTYWPRVNGVIVDLAAARAGALGESFADIQKKIAAEESSKKADRAAKLEAANVARRAIQKRRESAEREICDPNAPQVPPKLVEREEQENAAREAVLQKKREDEEAERKRKAEQEEEEERRKREVAERAIAEMREREAREKEEREQRQREEAERRIREEMLRREQEEAERIRKEQEAEREAAVHRACQEALRREKEMREEAERAEKIRREQEEKARIEAAELEIRERLAAEKAQRAKEAEEAAKAQRASEVSSQDAGVRSVLEPLHPQQQPLTILRVDGDSLVPCDPSILMAEDQAYVVVASRISPVTGQPRQVSVHVFVPAGHTNTAASELAAACQRVLQQEDFYGQPVTVTQSAFGEPAPREVVAAFRAGGMVTAADPAIAGVPQKAALNEDTIWAITPPKDQAPEEMCLVRAGVKPDELAANDCALIHRDGKFLLYVPKNTAPALSINAFRMASALLPDGVVPEVVEDKELLSQQIGATLAPERKFTEASIVSSLENEPAPAEPQTEAAVLGSQNAERLLQEDMRALEQGVIPGDSIAGPCVASLIRDAAGEETAASDQFLQSVSHAACSDAYHGLLRPDRAGVGCSQVWRVTDHGLEREVANGIFESGSTYVVLDTPNVGRSYLYVWGPEGAELPMDAVAAEPMLAGADVWSHVVEGNEPAHFSELWNPGLIVRKRGATGAGVFEMSEDGRVLHEIAPENAEMTPTNVLALIAEDGTSHIWSGPAAHPRAAAAAPSLTHRITGSINAAAPEPDVQKHGSVKPTFLLAAHALGTPITKPISIPPGLMSPMARGVDNYLCPAVMQESEPRLYRLGDLAAPQPELVEVPAFQQDDLDLGSCYVLDTTTQLHLWLPPQLSDSASRARAVEAAQKLARPRVPVTVCTCGSEPASFTSLFPTWVEWPRQYTSTDEVVVPVAAARLGVQESDYHENVAQQSIIRAQQEKELAHQLVEAAQTREAIMQEQPPTPITEEPNEVPAPAPAARQEEPTEKPAEDDSDGDDSGPAWARLARRKQKAARIKIAEEKQLEAQKEAERQAERERELEYRRRLLSGQLRLQGFTGLPGHADAQAAHEAHPECIPAPSGSDPTLRETNVSDAEFCRRLGVSSRLEFYQLPLWRQRKLKRQAGFY